MIGASKILTVSYGTFSCTLEGFDDPFNTMKAIAEYFRDLAAEDRYFGAEPPQPDAAMLHRIAEREIQRRVEARVQDNGVILRAEADSAPARIDAGEAAPTPAVIPAQKAAAVTESVAAKLSRLRAARPVDAAVVAAAQVVEAPEDLLPEPGLADFIAPPDAPVSGPADAAEPFDATPSAVEPDAPSGAEAEAEVEAEIGIVEVLDLPPPEMPDSAVVEAVPEAPAEAPEMLDLPEGLADELTDDAARALTDALSGPVAPVPASRPEHSIEELFPEGDALPDDPEDVLPESAVAVAGQDDVEDVDLAALIAAETAPMAEAAAGLPIEEHPAEAEADTLDIETIIGSLTDTDVAAEAGAPTETEAVPAPADEPDMREAARSEPAGKDVELADLEAFLDDEAEAIDVSVVYAEAETVVLEMARTAESETAHEAVTDQAPHTEPTPDLSGEEVADDTGAETRPEMPEKLMRARARVVRIRRGDVPEPMMPEPTAHETMTPAAPAAAAVEPRRMPGVMADDEALNRLIAQTNTELEGPDAKRRLSAIAHLKAAVAATVAERLARGKPAPSEATRAEPYRDDLARAVRPQRPEAPGLRGERPAPLVLVSEQRIDRPAAPPPSAPVAPVRPRRVTSAALAVQTTEDEDDDEDEENANLFADTRGFVEFAERLGVRSLPDLMEAAAAYTASVEGRPHFSRPHLIKHLSAARGAEIPREDSLRTFGRLLREGRIEKVKRGQFAVNEASRFLGEARKISG